MVEVLPQLVLIMVVLVVEEQLGVQADNLVMVLTLVQQEVEFTTAHQDKDMMVVEVLLVFK